MTYKKYLVGAIWHFKVEDNMGWSFCARLLKQDGYSDITPEKLKKDFNGYFKETVGIKPYVKCPKCGENLLPRKSHFGYFVGCSQYPRCNFMATESNPYAK